MAVHEAGCEFLDAPVTGSKGQLRMSGELVLSGGRRVVETLDRARPVLKAMSRGMAAPGASVGSGARMKLINNSFCAECRRRRWAKR